MVSRTLLIFGFLSGLLSAQPALQITSPANGTVVNPGQTLVVRVTASGGPFQAVWLNTSLPEGPPNVLTTAPYDFTIQIPPNTRPETYTLKASGVIGPGQGTRSQLVQIRVEPPTSPAGWKVSPSTITVWPGKHVKLEVTGKFASGPPLDMTYSTLTEYSTADPAIATIDNQGLITGIAPGKTFVGVGGWRLPVTVEPYMMVVPDTAVLYAGQSIDIGAQVHIASNLTATWSYSPAVGTLSTRGENQVTYTAPVTISTQQQVLVTATSVADPTKKVVTTITLSPPPTISVSPTTASLRAGQTQQFTATTTNSFYGGATWSLTPAGVGTISATGVYTAPMPIAANSTVTVKAISNQDPAKTATATLILKESQ
jgi:hypothetical protein